MSDIMTEVYKFETETLRRTVKQCTELLLKYGHTFDKSDRDKVICLIAMVKNKEDLDKTYENS
jgi:hypothetical protein